MPPGGRLPSQKELSVSFGVSRASVRVATKALNAMGYLDIIQGKGTFVRTRSASAVLTVTPLHEALEAVSFFDLMKAREILECNAAELAAAMADNAQLAAVEAAVERMTASRGERRRFLKADLDFHVAIAEATNNPVICEMMKLIVERMHHHDLTFQITSTGTYADAVATSRQILTHLVNSDGKKAFDGMQMHLRLVTDVLKTLITNGRVDPIHLTAPDRSTTSGHRVVEDSGA
jgi:GntR family transcriptional repressor for pyruvate dehydrogenase complex